MPTSARPLEIARFAPFWSGKTEHVDLALLGLASASSCWVVPFSTATEWPQRSASVFGARRCWLTRRTWCRPGRR